MRKSDKQRQKGGARKPRRQPNNRLREARENRGWSVDELADMLKVSRRTVERWEQGQAAPPPKMREKLRRAFGQDAVTLGFAPAGRALPSHFNLPYSRNPYFTGRERALERLYDALVASKQAGLPVAVCGLGGVGKTQLVIEHAYAHLEMYRAIFWVKGGSEDQLVADFVYIASLLDLAEAAAPDHTRAVEAVKQWLSQHGDWLLIFDNIEDLDLLPRFLPLPGCGQVVLTTPTQLVGTRASKLDLEMMDEEEGATLLLRRAGLVPPDARLARDRQDARELAREMDGLPLALDQAGAYIETDRCRVGEYLALYRERRAELLQRRGATHSDHPASVATTFSLAFEKVDKANPAATDLLLFCAFLQPDAIPEELITLAPDPGPLLQPLDPVKFHDALQTLLSYSLIGLVDRAAQARTLTMHRLVQAVLQDAMDEPVQWIERAARALVKAYEAAGAYMASEEEFYRLIARTARYDPHARECAGLIERWDLARAELALLLFAAGKSLRVRALYGLAEPLLRQAVSLCERVVGREHILTAQCLGVLALLYQEIGQYEQAEALYRQALKINERLPNNTLATIRSLDNLGQFLIEIGDYTRAQQCLERALALHHQAYGPEHPVSPALLHNLSRLYLELGQHQPARQLHEQASSIRRMQQSADAPPFVELLHAIQLDIEQGEYERAESLCREAQENLDRAGMPPAHPYRAELLLHKAEIYTHQHKQAEAEKLFRRALHILRPVLGPDHAEIAYVLDELAKLLAGQRRYVEAEALYGQALAMRKQTYGPEHFIVAQTLMKMGMFFQLQKRYAEAEAHYKQALELVDRTLGVRHENTGYILLAYISLLEEVGREREAMQLGQRLQFVDQKWKERWGQALQKRLAEGNQES